MTNVQLDIYDDVFEQFALLEEKLTYVDAPLEGIIRNKAGQIFAFRCSPIVAGYLWHWVLLPIQSIEASIEGTFDNARTTPPSQWISIVEDRRGEPQRVSVARLIGGVHPIPT